MKGLILTYALTYGGAAASLLNPYYGLLIYICFAIIKPEDLWHWSVPAGNYSRIVAIALLIGWAINGFGSWNLGKAKLPVLCLIAFWLWCAASALGSENHTLANAFLEATGKIVLPVVVGVTLIRSVPQLRQLAWVLVLSMGYVAFDLNVSYLQGFNRLEQVGFAGLDNNAMTIGLVTCIPLAFFLGLGTRSWLAKGVAFSSAAFMTHAVFFSFSRGGMVALVVAGIATLWILPKTPAMLSLYGFGILAALAMAGNEVRSEFTSSFADEESIDSSAESRKELWIIALRMTADNPILGVGPNHYPVYVDDYPVSAQWGERFPEGKECHSLWFQQMAETGIPGVLLLLLYYMLTIRGMRGSKGVFSSLDDSFCAQLYGMLMPSLLAFGVASQFVSLEGLEVPYYIALLGLGALTVAEGYDENLPHCEADPTDGLQ